MSLIGSIPLLLLLAGVAPRTFASDAPAAVPSPTPSPAPVETAEVEAPDAAGSQGEPARADFLPSRSWAGGSLHYGGEDLKVQIHGFVTLEYLDAEAQGSRNGVSTFDLYYANLFSTLQSVGT